MSEEREHEFVGLAFVACMFIGTGIGLAFDRPDVGGCIGMGSNFLQWVSFTPRKLDQPQ